MTAFYFQVEMTKPSGCYWTIGLRIYGETYTGALQIFTAWAFGVESMESLKPHLRNLGDTPTADRGYIDLYNPKEIFREMTTFLNESSHDPVRDPTVDTDDCPF